MGAEQPFDAADAILVLLGKLLLRGTGSKLGDQLLCCFLAEAFGERTGLLLRLSLERRRIAVTASGDIGPCINDVAVRSPTACHVQQALHLP